MSSKEGRYFWITNDLLEPLKKIQAEYNDERLSHSARRLIRESLKARAIEAEKA